MVAHPEAPKLSQITRSHAYTAFKFKRLESIRGFCAIYVAIGHTVLARVQSSPWTIVFRFGQEAVIVFFILSGFVIGWTTSDKSPGDWIVTYWWKRFIRIYSVLILSLGTLGAIDFFENSHHGPLSARQVIGNLLMLQDFADVKPAVFCSPLFGDTPLWSLHYEWWFYMAFPAVCVLPERMAHRHVVGLLGVIGSITYCLSPNIPCRLLMYLTIWWIGVEAAKTLRSGRPITLRSLAIPLMYPLVCGLPVGIVVLLEFLQNNPIALGVHPVLELRHLWGAVALVALALMWRKTRWFGFSLAVGWCAALAPISFSMYAIHYRSLSYAKYLNGRVPEQLELPLYVLVTITFCYVAECVIFPVLRRLTPYTGKVAGQNSVV